MKNHRGTKKVKKISENIKITKDQFSINKLKIVSLMIVIIGCFR